MRVLIYLTVLLLWQPRLDLFAQKVRPRDSRIPHAYDAFRMWDLLPQQRIGVRAYMRSTYDRTGAGYDASNFLFMNREDENVTLDVKGKGVLYFFRTNHWHGSPWHFKIDGSDHLVSETATADPVDAAGKFKTTAFIPQKAFPQPLAWTWGTTKGADLIWTPMPFRDSLQIAYSRTFYGTGYYIYHLYANEQALSGPLRSWNSNIEPDKDIVQLFNRAGTDIAPANIKKLKRRILLNQKSLTLAHVESASSSVKALKLTLPLNEAINLERIRLKVTWDNSAHASIDAPLCLFFGAGTFFNRDEKEFLVKGLPINIRYDYIAGKVELACYYPMPFFKTARFELTNITPGHTEIDFELRYDRLKSNEVHNTTYFHATYKDIPKPEFGQDMTWLDTREMEGHAQWSGNFVGTSFIFSHNANLSTLEGDPRFFFDDSLTPQAYGTGTEEWAGGGDYWGGENMTLPLAGHPCGATEKKAAVNDKDLIQSAYRFLVSDLMPFGKRAVIKFEHNENVSREHYETVCYWYGVPVPVLVKTDSLDIGSIEDEKRHHYITEVTSKVDTILSRYEWGPDAYPAHAWGYDLSKMEGYKHLIGKEIYAAHSEDGRASAGISAFNVKLDPRNAGVLLRRKLDYSYPNQMAEVFIADLSKGREPAAADWRSAGIWYLAGSNTFVTSRPKGELSPRVYQARTSNRRFRDDEFLIPANLTKNSGMVRIKIKPIASQQSLYPGHPFPKKSLWSELRYQVYSYLLPDFKIKR
ncbi:MAG TPA: DUF2961 domain-containing protein [Pedobacter sp.]|uniref:DUF2961 domain-containing protein n=1 Tax=Pedobacter sp. TaxID=1411316 RepID=UPI002CE40B24|nr:DUF2961 domain-containing protein [Pedobacter sp.]HMI01295.1 DUF2961 domain-containing protein [Pedobacter sp.]